MGVVIEGRSSILVVSVIAILTVFLIPCMTDISMEVSAYTSHSAIAITNNEGFIDASLVVGGSGTELDPYIISGWEFTASNEIMNTDKWFVIRACAFLGGSASLRMTNVLNGNVESSTFSASSTSGIEILSSRNILVTDCYFNSNGDQGIAFQIDPGISYLCENNTISDCRFSGSRSAIVVHEYCRNITIRDNSITGASVSGITAYGYESLISNNTCELNGDSGIRVDGYMGSNCVHGSNNTVCDNICVSNRVGINLTIGSENNTVSNNTCSLNSRSGIEIHDIRNEIANNTCVSNEIGVLLIAARDNHVFNNSIQKSACSSNESAGIAIWNSDDNLLHCNEINDSVGFGAAIFGSSTNNLLWNNTLIRNNGADIDYNPDTIQALDDGMDNDWCLQIDLAGHGNYWQDWLSPDSDRDGIVDSPYSISGSAGSQDVWPLARAPSTPYDYPIVIDGNSDFADQALLLSWAGDGSIENPYVIENYSIDAASSHFGICINNTNVSFIIRNCSIFSAVPTYADLIRLDHVENGTVLNNSLSGTSGIIGVHVANSSHNTFTNNSCLGNTYAHILLRSCSMNAVDNNSCTNGIRGIWLDNTTSTSVSNNTLISNGIMIDGTSMEDFSSHIIKPDNTVNGLEIRYYVNATGVTMNEETVGQVIAVNCSNTLFTNLEILDVDTGIIVAFSHDGILGRNTLQSCDCDGILIVSSTNFTVIGNTICCSGHGIRIQDSNLVDIVHNNFVDNAIQASDDGGAVNFWDKGYPEGGNYWSNYLGPDLYNGDDQDTLGDDGIGDFPHLIDSNSIDHYPLMAPNNNTIPLATFTVLPLSGNITETFTANASESYDIEDGQDILIRWDWEGDGIWDTSLSADRLAGHQYNQPGLYAIALEVRDTAGLSSRAHETVEVVNEAPDADFVVTPAYGTVVTDFYFDACLSEDLEDPIGALEVRWDWENDGSWDTDWSVEKTASHIYLSPGEYVTKLQVRDTYGGIDYASKSVTTNNTIPVASFTVTPGIGNASTSFVVNAGSSWDREDSTYDLMVRWNWDWDGTSDSWDTEWSAAKNASHQYPEEGMHAIRLEVKDSHGGLCNVTQSIVVDTRAPVTSATISGVTEDGWYIQSSPRVILSASDDISGVLRIECELYTPMTNETARLEGEDSIQLTIPDGIHILTYYARDTSGNVEHARNISLSVDCIGPSSYLEIVDAIPGGEGWFRSSVSIHLTAQDSTSGINWTEYRVDSGSPIRVYDLDYVELEIQGDGVHTIVFYSCDVAGNHEADNTRSFKIDCAPPETAAVTVLGTAGTEDDGAQWYVSSLVLISLAGDDGNLSGVIATWYRIDDSQLTTCQEGHPIEISGDGKHLLSYSSLDVAGNNETVRTLPVWIDTTSPATSPFTDRTLNEGNWTSAESVNITLSADDGNGSGIYTTFYSLDGLGYLRYESPITISGDGYHSVRYYSVDANDLAEVVDETFIGIDTEEPVLNINIIEGSRPGDFTLYLTDSYDSTSGIGNLQILVDERLQYSGPMISSFQISGLTEGTHPLKIFAMDNAANEAQLVGSFGVGPGGLAGVILEHWTEFVGVGIGIVVTIMADQIISRHRTKNGAGSRKDTASDDLASEEDKKEPRVSSEPSRSLPDVGESPPHAEIKTTGPLADEGHTVRRLKISVAPISGELQDDLRESDDDSI